MHDYCKYADETEVVFTDIMKNENEEPIHVYVSKGKPVANSTKYGLLKVEDIINYGYNN